VRVDKQDRTNAESILKSRIIEIGDRHRMCKSKVPIRPPGRRVCHGVTNMSVKHLLQRRHIPFEVISHSKAFDASHLAHALHTPGKLVAKTVLLRVDHQERYVIAMLPSTHKIDFAKLSSFFGGATIELATEHEINLKCQDCEYGVIPPFGSHYGAQTVVDASLANSDDIAFERDSFTEAIRMKYLHFYDYEHPLVADFASPTQPSN
jgi:Ala-tRNA(Pro) deacylase